MYGAAMTLVFKLSSAANSVAHEEQVVRSTSDVANTVVHKFCKKCGVSKHLFMAAYAFFDAWKQAIGLNVRTQQANNETGTTNACLLMLGET